MVSLEQALDALRGMLAPSGVEVVDVQRALGRILARDVMCPGDIPEDDTATMDGYAVRAVDLKADRTFQVVGAIRAGQLWEETIGDGQGLRIMTGAILPPGADAILPVEKAEYIAEDRIRANGDLSCWAHVRRRGEYARRGDRLFREGERLGPEDLAILCGIGLARVMVRRRPRIGILVTGSELVSLHEQPNRGQVFATHGVYLQALLASEGACAVFVTHVPDEIEQLEGAISHPPDVDLLLTTGGTGRGDGDMLFEAMQALGASVLFRGIRMRPGRGITLYRVAKKRPVLALPGGIGGVQVGFEVLVRPAIRWLQGETLWAGNRLQCLTQVSLPRDPHAHRFLEARIWGQDGRLLTAPLPRGPRGGGLPARSTQGWIEIPPGQGTIPPGNCVSVRPRRESYPDIVYSGTLRGCSACGCVEQAQTPSNARPSSLLPWAVEGASPGCMNSASPNPSWIRSLR